ncbi:MAG: septum formation protein Maf [Bacteroides sp.]|nr:septum formation protein Maf [Bacteroides sp.]
MTPSILSLDHYRVMLASASPRRHELLKMLGVDFTVAPSVEVNEVYPRELPAEDVAPYLAALKAEAYRRTMHEDALMITADTVVIAEGKVLGKPADESEAIAMLHALSGRTHKVVTGICVFTPEKMLSDRAETEVTFAPLTEEEIREYVTVCHPLDKAGAYGIQEWIGAIGVQSIHGSFYNVMGLPLHKLYTLLKEF